MAKNNFAVFIISNGRPESQITLKSLQQSGYTGDWYIIIDNEDQTADKYKNNFGDHIIIFDKTAAAQITDSGDNFQDKRSPIYARNAAFGIAKSLDLEYFLVLDDDYKHFGYEVDMDHRSALIKDLDAVFEYLLEFYKSIPALSIAIAQGGDFVAGDESQIFDSINSRRKCMNTFFCSVNRPYKFYGKMNDDVTTYTWLQSLGNLFLTFPLVEIHQVQTQSQVGGLTGLYLDFGTYVKSFYTVMFQPSSVTVGIMNSDHPRLHHIIDWDHTVPCIIEESYRKPRESAIIEDV